MIKYILSLLALVALLLSATNVANAKIIYEYFEEIEPLLMERKFTEAEAKFKNLDDKIKHYSINGDFVIYIYNDFIKYLKKSDEIRMIIEDANKNPSKYEANGNYGISENCQGYRCKHAIINELNKALPSVLPFSKQFVEYVNKHNAETIESFNKTNRCLSELKILVKEQKEELIRKKREEEKKAREAKLEAERKARKAKKKKEEDALNAQIEAIDKAAKKAGYGGYSGKSIVALIYETQRKGGLEKYLNKVIGCNKLQQSHCKKWYPKLKIIQVLDNGLLYSFSEFSGQEDFDFIIYVDKEPGKIYQDGQSIENDLYVFRGMFSYQTVFGASKSVPAFAKAKIKLNQKSH